MISDTVSKVLDAERKAAETFENANAMSGKRIDEAKINAKKLIENEVEKAKCEAQEMLNNAYSKADAIISEGKSASLQDTEKLKESILQKKDEAINEALKIIKG